MRDRTGVRGRGKRKKERGKKGGKGEEEGGGGREGGRDCSTYRTIFKCSSGTGHTEIVFSHPTCRAIVFAKRDSMDVATD
jgi:hypothetical protein